MSFCVKHRTLDISRYIVRLLTEKEKSMYSVIAFDIKRYCEDIQLNYGFQEHDHSEIVENIKKAISLINEAVKDVDDNTYWTIVTHLLDTGTHLDVEKIRHRK